MPVTVDFLPFADGGGANVIDQPTYAGATSTTNGYTAGLAKSNFFNKTWRQATFPVAAIANYMANVLNQNVLDDGVLTNFWSQFWQSLMVGGSFADTGSANTIVIAAPAGLTFPAPVFGLKIAVKLGFANTSTTVNLNWMGTGNKRVKYTDGEDPLVGDFPAQGELLLMYDGAQWQCLSVTISAVNTRIANAIAPITTATAAPRLANGQCYFQYVSTTQVQLIPYSGNNLVSGGVQYQLSNAGLSAANTGITLDGTPASNLATNTAYYVSFNGAGNVLKFWTLSTHSHMPDTTAGNTGVEVISSGGVPITGETLVGMVNTAPGSNQFQIQGKGTISWYNQKPLAIVGATVAGPTNTTSATFVEAAIGARLRFVEWAGVSVTLYTNGAMSNASGAAVGIGLDGTTFPGTELTGSVAGSGAPISLCITSVAEGDHYGTTLIAAPSGGTTTISEYAVLAQVFG